MKHSPRKSSQGRRQRNQLRIIGGKWRGRKLDFPDLDGLRPTSDRIRETVFNWLAPILPGARCLDLFAGSGALALEALSRGAANAVMVECDGKAAAALRAHCRTLDAEQRAEVIQADALAWLAGASRPGFDIVFLDPPFQAGLHQRAAGALEQSGVFAAEACLYVESDRGQALALPPAWQLWRDKVAGNVRYQLYRRAFVPAG